MTQLDSSTPSIEDLILSRGYRGIDALRPYLSPDYCSQAARFMYGRPGTALIVTGFYEDVPHTIETDGPPGALALGRAWEGLERKVVYVSDRHGVPFLEPEAGESEVVEFPITSPQESLAFSRSLLERYDPSVVVAIERCSLTGPGSYFNTNTPRKDISAYTARVDDLFTQHPATVGVGDGGNEIGMGKLKDVIRSVTTLAPDPAETACTHLVICTVSNWGGYGLAAALAILSGRDLLVSREDEAGIIRRMVDRGAVDGKFLKRVYGVDGMTLEENLEVLDALHEVVRRQRAPS